MYDRILVPVDASDAALAGLQEAVRLARLCDARVRLLHVVEEQPFVSESVLYQAEPLDPVSKALEAGTALLAHLRDDASRDGIVVDTVLVESAGRRLYEVINEQASAWQASLIALGTHGRTGVERFVVGSAAEQVLRHAAVPLLLVRAPHEARSERGLQSIAAAIA